jgi:hypothetical protein
MFTCLSTETALPLSTLIKLHHFEAFSILIKLKRKLRKFYLIELTWEKFMQYK